MSHVLIVEDHEENRNLLKMLLAANGYRVTVAGDGVEALAAARRDRPDVIVSDALMPKMDGFALCRAWTQDAEFKAIPFIFYSGTYVRPGDAQFAMALGAVRYLIKPVESEVFLGELRTVLQQWAGHAAPVPASPLDDTTSHALHESVLARKVEDKIAQLEAANRTLQESEARFRSLFETMMNGFAYCRMEYDDRNRPMDFVYLRVNDAFERLTGLKNVLGKKVSEVIPGIRELSPELFEIYGRVASTGVPEAFEFDFKSLAKWLTVSVYSPARNYFVAIFDDITERKRVEMELRASEARFRKLTEMSSDFYWETDSEHRFTQGNWDANVNVALVWRAQIGLRRWDMPYLSPNEAAWQAHRAALDAHLPFRDFQLSRLDIDGTEHFLSLNGDPLFDESGAFKGYRGVGTDITGRKQAEERLRAAEEQFRGLVEQSIAGSYIVQDGKFAYVNPRFAQILGYDSAEELIGRDGIEVIAEKDRPIILENRRRMIEGEVRSANYTFTALKRDGTTVEVGAHSTRATHRGRPAMIGLLQDISEKQRAEKEIQRYIAQLQTAFRSTVEVATIISEMRDPYTAGHERRVAEIAVAIGAELGFDAHRQEGLQVAGHLHDIGKVTIPSEILSKPGKLSATEFQLIQGHAQASYDVLKGVEFPWPVAQIALQHHERMDGSGYPKGLKGEAILLESRIMAVADVVEAMSSHRPYRPGLGIEKALAEIERGRGTSYDPVVADACLRLLREKGYTVPA